MQNEGDFVEVMLLYTVLVIRLVPRLIMGVTVLLLPLFPYRPPWLAMGQIYLYLCSTDEVCSTVASKFYFYVIFCSHLHIYVSKYFPKFLACITVFARVISAPAYFAHPNF